ncbi:helix-turn-helix domain-containing protein [Streptomyces yunnanensis]|uniref:Helix-turn-helix domain-containing protein n=1 Tax=Streptomyces yunnanensis TaxID=156453 RepID=A0ABY8AHB7_9ACTN|nr:MULTISPECIES: helix-turn-helix transcriptional regulator [Streptomyces]QRX90826.1 helix-turn-helix transcriptional regulator [Streptomyces noursei]WEB44041.1 helix-turn-helix domain-containing protein [Streptomyces yunnanensis]
MAYTPAHLIAAAQTHGDHTTAEIARRLGVPYVSAYRWVTGRHAPGPEGLAAIERAYGVTAATIFTGEAP